MMILRLALLSSLAILGCHAGSIAQPSAPVSRSDGKKLRTFMTVEFDYMLEANKTIIISTNSSSTTEESESQDNIFHPNPLEQALLEIDTNIIGTIQERIPNGDIPEGKKFPDVKFNSINTRFVNMCFTESDACKWVKSRIQLSFVDDRSKSAMERVTLNLVQEYLRDVNEANDFIDTTYVYPMIHSSTVQLEFSPVEGPMSDEDIDVLEGCFFNIYHAIVSALDGDTDVSDAFFVYQDVQELTGGGESKLAVNVKYFGKCRYCTEAELTKEINDAVESNRDILLSNIKIQSNSTFYDGIQNISFSLPIFPDELPAINEAIFDAEAPRATKSVPWSLYAGAFAAVIVLLVGICVICKDQKDLRKEEASTGNESDSFDGKLHEGAAAAAPGVERKGSESDDNSSSLNTNSLNTSGMHDDYQVYVY